MESGPACVRWDPCLIRNLSRLSLGIDPLVVLIAPSHLAVQTLDLGSIALQLPDAGASFERV